MLSNVRNSNRIDIIFCILLLFSNISLLSSATPTGFLKNQPNPDMEVETVLQFISADSVSSIIKHLQSYDTRFMLAPNRFEVSQWIFNEFKKMGFTDVQYDSFQAATSISLNGFNIDTVTTQRNVIATIQGSVDPEQEIIFCGHYDSFNSEDNPFVQAPGADDNASGTVAVLETARAFKLSGFVPEKTIRFIAFAAEELLFFGDAGSEHYSQTARSNNDQIILVINHDMISHTYQSLENSMVHINRHPDSYVYSRLGITCIEKFTEINVQTENSWSSDLLSFHESGYKGIYFEEAEFSPYYHTSYDIQDNYNMQFCKEVIKASAATLVSLSLIPDQLVNLQVEDWEDENSALVKWSPAIESDVSHYRLHVTDEHGMFDELYTPVDTYQVVKGLSVNNYYNFEISAVDFDGWTGLTNSREYLQVKFTKDGGILLVDGTHDGNGALLNPTDEQVDLFYDALCENYKISKIDIAQDGIRLGDIVEYSTIIWHGDQNLESLHSFTPDLQRFLRAGGNFIYTGEKPTLAFAGNYTYPNYFTEDQFIYKYLKISETDNKFGSRFNSAISRLGTYPDIYTDTLKTKIQTSYHLRDIESIYPAPGAQALYLFSSAYDSNTVQGAMNGQPVAVVYKGDYNTAILSFPLYYMEYEASCELMDKLLQEEFGEVTLLAKDNDQKPQSFTLYQNFPNPFNSATEIKYSLNQPGKVSIYVYDIFGRQITVLINENQSAGEYVTQWKGSLYNGQSVASGVYFYRMNQGIFTDTKKMILIK